MKKIIAVLSDVHSNLESIEAVSKALQKIKADFILFLGDVVGYGPDPRECIKSTTQIATAIVKGNHEELVSNQESFHEKQQDVSIATHLSTIYTRDLLSLTELDFLKNLKRVIRFEKESLSITHGSFLDQGNFWKYVQTQTEAQEELRELKTQIGFFGHTHISGIFVEGKLIYGKKLKDSYRIDLSAGGKILVNPGSVGLTREGDISLAHYAILILDQESKTAEVRFEKVPYDVMTTIRKVKALGLTNKWASKKS